MPLWGAADFGKYIETIDRLLEFDADNFVCGHLNKVGTRAEVLQTLEFTEDVKKAAEVRASPASSAQKPYAPVRC